MFGQFTAYVQVGAILLLFASFLIKSDNAAQDYAEVEEDGREG